MSCHGLNAETRRQVDSVVHAWRLANELPIVPLAFSGADGQYLCTKQYVGVIEVDDVTIEIFPKLDATLLTPTKQRLEDSTGTVMSNLMWMLDVAEHREIVEAGTAHLEEEPTSFFDLFAYLLGRNLLPQLQVGVHHSYIGHEGDVTTVRGRVGILKQITKNWNRYDRVYCQWDEFTPDNSLNRVLKCACRYLSERVKYVEAMRVLADCQALLIDVDDIPAVWALRQASTVRFDRANERFKSAFDLAHRLLAGVGHNLGVGDANTFVFLIDMNELFEAYVQSVLESHFGTAVEEQVTVGTLLRLKSGGIRQVADYQWGRVPDIWIGDAKYKHMTQGQSESLKFRDIKTEGSESTSEPGEVPLAGQVLSSADVRQLTVYAELVRVNSHLLSPPKLMLLYPFVGDVSRSKADDVTAWNGSEFWLVPVLVKRLKAIGDAIPSITRNA